MNKKEEWMQEEYQDMIEAIESHSPYKRKPSPQKKWMSVAEMGELLGLKKTDRYWLLHKNVFESREIAGKLRVNIASFEKWYANQVKYQKVTGEEPGLELKEWSFSVRDIAQLLEIEESVAYDLVKRARLETVTIDYWKRIPKDVFWNWYNGQTKYQTAEDRKAKRELYEATISMPDMARLLGVSRGTVYTLLKSRKYGKYFSTVIIADQKRITKESFQKFLDEQEEYQLSPCNDYKELAVEENIALANYRRKKLLQTGDRRCNGNLSYLTPEEAALMAKVSRSMIVNWYQREEFPIIHIGNRVRICRKEFEAWLEERRKKNGVHTGTKPQV